MASPFRLGAGRDLPYGAGFAQPMWLKWRNMCLIFQHLFGSFGAGAYRLAACGLRPATCGMRSSGSFGAGAHHGDAEGTERMRLG